MIIYFIFRRNFFNTNMYIGFTLDNKVAFIFFLRNKLRFNYNVYIIKSSVLLNHNFFYCDDRFERNALIVNHFYLL